MRKLIAALAVVFVGLLIFAMGGAEQDGPEISSTNWRPIGPPGGNISGMAFNPMNKNEIYAVSSSGQLFRSTNTGTSWRRIAVLDNSLYDVLVDPENSSIVYALNDSHVYKTTNRGSTWTTYSLGNNCYGEQIAVHPTNPNILFVAGYRYHDTKYGRYCMAVFKSVDSGQNWSYKQFAASHCSSGSATSISISPANPNIVYVGGYYHDTDTDGEKIAVFKSTNGGSSYSNKTGGIKSVPYSIVSHPTDPNKAYVGTSMKIFRSTNGGNSWQENNGEIYCHALALDSFNPDILYSGFSKNIYKSTNGGVDWTEYKSGLYGDCSGLLVNLSRIYYCSKAGIYKSTNGGVSWASANAGIKAVDAWAMAIAPSLPSTIYVSAPDNGFFKSTNSGSSWMRMPYFNVCESVFRIAVKSTDSKSLYILTSG
jgi:photosystem II stability/assembly factor-like uncharacterized protein